MKFVVPNAKWSRQPLVWLTGALLLTILPLIYFAEIPWWIILVSAGAGWYRWVREVNGLGPPSAPAKFILVGGATLGIVLSRGTLLGLDESLAFLVVLAGCKILEMRTAREFSLAIFIGYFLVMAALLYSQSLLYCLYSTGLILLYTTVLVHFGIGMQTEFRPRKTMRLAGGLLLRVAPLVLVLFIVFPRTQGGFILRMGATPTAVSGMTDSLQPGSLERIAGSTETAFRVSFPDGDRPPTADLYWRGVVLWQALGDGFEWVAGDVSHPGSMRLEGPSIQQRITLMAHGERWLFALDYPNRMPGSRFGPGGYLVGDRDINRSRIYSVSSRPLNRQISLDEETLRQALQVPDRVPPEAVALAEEWREAAASPREIVNQALEFFSDRFRYTLSPGSVNTLERFLFQSRRGFCEHYAASFATLMRLAGVPSRVVCGYHGGDYNRYGDYLSVRQLDAHAWCEVWYEGEGWRRVDPTVVVEPLRINEGMAAFLDSGRAGDLGISRLQGFLPTWEADTVWRQRFLNARMAWETLNYRWDLWIMGYDDEIQENVMAGAAWFRAQSGAWWFGVIFGLITIVIAIVWMLPKSLAPAHRMDKCYRRFLKKVSASGLRKEPAEGEWNFGQRVAAQAGPHAETIREFSRLYCRAKYDPESSPEKLLEKLKKSLKAIPKLRP